MRPSNPPASLAVRPLDGDPTLELLQSLDDRAERDRHGLYLAEGFRALYTAVAHSAPIAGLAICRELLHSSEARQTAKALKVKGVPLLHLTCTQFRNLARAPEPRGAMLILQQQWWSLPHKVRR